MISRLHSISQLSFANKILICICVELKIWKPYTGPAAELLRWSTLLMKLLFQNMDFFTKLCCNKLVCTLFKLVIQCLTKKWFDHSYQKMLKLFKNLQIMKVVKH